MKTKRNKEKNKHITENGKVKCKKSKGKCLKK